jgi:putative transposase
MARPLRVDRRDGWYHVTARGLERRDIFNDLRARLHFLELVEEMTQLFRVQVHAYVLMSNHYHLVVQTPEANLSRAIQWLNVSYAAWFNRRNDRVGPLFQGRFKGLLVEDAGWAYELTLYVHLNPVMSKAHGLDKKGKQQEKKGLRTASSEQIARRLAELRGYPWSSYRAYAGFAGVPKWLTTKDVLVQAGSISGGASASYRQAVKDRLLMGASESRAEAMRDAFALGGEAFRAEIRKLVKGGREIVEPTGLASRPTWPEFVRKVERVMDEKAESFMNRRGSFGKPLLLWLARRYGGMTLREAGAAAGGMDYTAVAMSIKRLELRARGDAKLRKLQEVLAAQCEM